MPLYKRFAVFILLAAGAVAAGAPTKISMITGSSLGTYAQIGQNIKQLCTNFQVTLFESAGSSQNVSQVLKNPKNVNFGIAQLDVLYVLEQLGSDADKAKLKKLKMVVPLYSEEIHLLVRHDKKIRTLLDLKGKRVNVGPRGSGTQITTILIKSLAKIKWKEKHLKTPGALSSLLKGKIDAMFYVIGMPVPVFEKLSAKAGKIIKLISVSHPILNKLYKNTTIPSYTYPWQVDGVKTYQIPSILMTHASTPKATVAGMAKCIASKIEVFRQTKHRKWREVYPKKYAEVKWPLHPAAKTVLAK